LRMYRTSLKSINMSRRKTMMLIYSVI